MMNVPLKKKLTKLLDDAALQDYVPNPVETPQIFLERKKRVAESASSKDFDAVANGVIAFSITPTENNRIKELLGKFIDFDVASIANEHDTLETIIKALTESSPFGLAPEDYDELLAISDKTWKDGDKKTAAEMYQALIYLFPQRIESWLSWAEAEIENDDFDYRKVLGIYERCSKIFNHPAVPFGIGVCQIKGNETQLAQDAFQKTIELCEKYNDNELKQKVETILASLKNMKL
jgi:tetratricopeptide (TPR) repeat protein